jgi:hypothetical protein
MRNIPNLPTKWAMKYICRQMRKDQAWRNSWHANIAMPIYDATRPQCYCHNLLSKPDQRPEHFHGCEILQANTIPRRFECREMSIEQSNYIANRLMKHLFDA